MSISRADSIISITTIGCFKSHWRVSTSRTMPIIYSYSTSTGYCSYYRTCYWTTADTTVSGCKCCRSIKLSYWKRRVVELLRCIR